VLTENLPTAAKQSKATIRVGILALITLWTKWVLKSDDLDEETPKRSKL